VLELCIGADDNADLDHVTDASQRDVLRSDLIRPRFGHIVIGTPDAELFLVHEMGFKLSDQARDVAALLRCSTDHHNLLLQPSPVPFLHYTSGQVANVDEVGRGAMHMLFSAIPTSGSFARRRAA